MHTKPKVYFLGSGKLAEPFLKRLAASEHLDFVGGATGVSRPGKRGNALLPTPAKKFAGTLGIGLEEVADVNDPGFVGRLKKNGIDVLLVVSFGQILREEILAVPHFGGVNVHPSLLPRFRGASPVVQTVLYGDEETGVCYMEVAPALDAGKIYRVFRRKLAGDEYADELEAELSETAAAALDETIAGIISGAFPGTPQQGEVTFCTKIAKKDAALDWKQDAREIGARVRAYHKWPGAYALEIPGNRRVTISRALPRMDQSGVPGETVSGAPKDQLIVGCGRGALEILEVVPAGGKPMTGAAFRNGRRGQVRFSTESSLSGSE